MDKDRYREGREGNTKNEKAPPTLKELLARPEIAFDNGIPSIENIENSDITPSELPDVVVEAPIIDHELEQSPSQEENIDVGESYQPDQVDVSLLGMNLESSRADAVNFDQLMKVENSNTTPSELPGAVQEAPIIDYELEQSPSQAENIDAAESCQPGRKDASLLEVQLEAARSNSAYFDQFMYETFGTPNWLKKCSEDASDRIFAEYDPHVARWTIRNKNSDKGIKAGEVYGTPRANAYAIFEDTLNLKDAEVWDNSGDQFVLNNEETELARTKQKIIEAEFSDWISRDPDRQAALDRTFAGEGGRRSTVELEYIGESQGFTIPCDSGKLILEEALAL